MSFWFVNLFVRVIRVLPLAVALLIGKIGGILFYLLTPKKRDTAYRNLKLAFPHKSNQEIFLIIKRSFINFGISFIEALIPDKIISKGWFQFEQLQKIKEPGIIVGIHSGSWEFYIALLAQKYKFAVLAKKQKSRLLNRFLLQQRMRNNIAVTYNLKNLIRYINNGYCTGLVIDHGAEDNALAVDFFGVAVPTPKGAVALARRFGKKIYPLFAYRDASNNHQLEAADAIDPSDLSDQQVLRKLNSIYEQFLTSHPEQYMWWYKRFKKKKQYKAIILNDTRKGHLKQSLALLQLCKEQGYNIDQKIIDVKVKNKIKRFLIEICALLPRKMAMWRLHCLSWLLNREAYQQLTTNFADLVISTGSMLAPINAIFSHSLGAKSAVILRPNLPLNKFNLAIIPEHDRLRYYNTVNIKGALSYPPDVSLDKEKLQQHFTLGPRKKVSLFIGGPLEEGERYKKNLISFIKRFKEFVLAHDYGILVSTSRRTPGEIEGLVEQELNNFSNTEAVVIANKKNYPFISGGFLAVSEVVFVTADSISMISESLTLKRTTVSVELEEIVNMHHLNFFASIEDMISFLRYPYYIRTLNKANYSLFEYNRRLVSERIEVLF
jgi:KDO2-lipid IV(A) lauroyltransferase